MKIEFNINELNSMKKYPKELFYRGNLELLKREKISIIGTRRPSSYSKFQTAQISSKLSNRGVCIVSGAAMGIDSIAHQNAGASNTIGVMANGLDIKYPNVNKSIITNIEKEGLVLSQFKEGFRATPWSFVVRNEIVVALGDCLIVSEADLKSGSMRSVDFALKMKKKIYVLPHRVDESKGTNYLLKEGLATAIYDIDEFVSKFGSIFEEHSDEFLEYCKTRPNYDEAIERYKDKVFLYELEGKIKIINNIISIN
jgi:DNA processing protein